MRFLQSYDNFYLCKEALGNLQAKYADRSQYQRRFLQKGRGGGWEILFHGDFHLTSMMCKTTFSFCRCAGFIRWSIYGPHKSLNPTWISSNVRRNRNGCLTQLEKCFFPPGTVFLGGIFLILRSNFPNIEEDFPNIEENFSEWAFPIFQMSFPNHPNLPNELS